MRLRFDKTVLGTVYRFYVIFKPKSYKCTYDGLGLDLNPNEEHTATISDDFKKIILDKPITLKGYYDSFDKPIPTKIITSLVIPKEMRFNVKNYIQPN